MMSKNSNKNYRVFLSVTLDKIKASLQNLYYCLFLLGEMNNLWHDPSRSGGNLDFTFVQVRVK